MRATILPKATILTNVPRVAVSMMAKLSLKCFLFLLTNYIHIWSTIM